LNDDWKDDTFGKFKQIIADTVANKGILDNCEFMLMLSTPVSYVVNYRRDLFNSFKY